MCLTRKSTGSEVHRFVSLCVTSVNEGRVVGQERDWDSEELVVAAIHVICVVLSLRTREGTPASGCATCSWGEGTQRSSLPPERGERRMSKALVDTPGFPGPFCEDGVG